MKQNVVALGTFDGAHRGHRKIIKAAVKFARRKKLSCAVLTFDPHPQRLVAPERGLQILTTLKEREKLIKSLGADRVIAVKFTPRIQRQSPRQFVSRFLAKRLKAKAVFVGFDYAFGKERSGDVFALKRLGKEFGFAVFVVPPVKANHHPVKSSQIRSLISHGDFGEALRLLGHGYPISGKVVSGSGRGKLLGFPTANLLISRDKLLPAYGVYCGKALFNSKNYRCAVNIGSRPTFGEESVAVEVYLLAFKGNLYGKFIELELERRLREEIHFSDVEELRKQIRRDIAKAGKLC